MPTVTMIAGPNGSGKSTLKDALERDGVNFGLWLNADEIARSLQGTAPAVSERAQIAVREARSRALAEGRDHCFETVMSHRSHFDHLEQARAAGFTVALIYVALSDPRINVNRVANRVENGGHDVPSERIEARYHRSLALLPEAITRSDFARVFDNSDWNAGYRLLATRDDRGPLLMQAATLPAWFAALLPKFKAEGLLDPDRAAPRG